MSYRVQQIDDDYLERKSKKDKGSVKYPKCFKVEVDISKVNLTVIKEWITDKINEQLPDDDIVIDYLYELLQANEKHPDIRGIQVQLNDFLGVQESKKFCEKLWKLMISAQDDADGIPKEILEKRRKEYDELEKKEQQGPHKRKTNYNRSSIKEDDFQANRCDDDDRRPRKHKMERERREYSRDSRGSKYSITDGYKKRERSPDRER